MLEKQDMLKRQQQQIEMMRQQQQLRELLEQQMRVQQQQQEAQLMEVVIQSKDIKNSRFFIFNNIVYVGLDNPVIPAFCWATILQFRLK